MPPRIPQAGTQPAFRVLRRKDKYYHGWCDDTYFGPPARWDLRQAHVLPPHPDHYRTQSATATAATSTGARACAGVASRAVEGELPPLDHVEGMARNNILSTSHSRTQARQAGREAGMQAPGPTRLLIFSSNNMLSSVRCHIYSGKRTDRRIRLRRVLACRSLMIRSCSAQ